MKKMTALALAGILTVFCLTGCSDSEGSTVISEATTTVTTSATTSTAPESAAESTTTTTTATAAADASDSETESETQPQTTAKPADTTTTTQKGTTSTTTTTTKKTTTTTTTTTKKITSTTTTTTTTASKPEPAKNRVVLDVKNIQMLPELPCGSELTSLAMVFNYWGINVSKIDLINYINLDKEPDPDTGRWGNPHAVFVGDPTKGGYGCYCEVLNECAKKYLKSNNINDLKPNNRVCGKEHFINQINKGNPIIVWITKGLINVQPGDRWIMEDGYSFYWTKGQYCAVIIGYDLDKNTFILSDPTDSKGIVEYSIDRIDEVNLALNGNSLIIYKKT